MARTVLVTGASRGIGRRIVEVFIDQGDHVVALSRSGEAPNGTHTSLSVDVSDPDAVSTAIKSLSSDLGPIEVAVLNAGITHDGLGVRMSNEQWRSVLAVNLDGAFYCARAVLAPMIRHRAGSVIFVSSISPFIGVAGQANYAASKAGLVGLARSLAREVASRSINVNVVAPGFIDTEMTASLASSLDTVAATIPMGRIGQPDDVAGVVTFLASAQARYITGAVLAVDGGLSMGL